jgi:hypothetical protein
MGERTGREEDDNDGRRQNASDGRERDDFTLRSSRSDLNQERPALTKREREQRWPIG